MSLFPFHTIFVFSVCEGMQCVGQAPQGHRAREPSLGWSNSHASPDRPPLRRRSCLASNYYARRKEVSCGLCSTSASPFWNVTGIPDIQKGQKIFQLRQLHSSLPVYSSPHICAIGISHSWQKTQLRHTEHLFCSTQTNCCLLYLKTHLRSQARYFACELGKWATTIQKYTSTTGWKRGVCVKVAFHNYLLFLSQHFQHHSK